MPAAPQYQNVFRINKADGPNDSNGNQIYATKAKRNRQPLSCDACRLRKLKCDRQTPCAPCSKRGDAASSSCNYSKINKDGGNASNRPTFSNRSEAQFRLQKLEEMVTGLMQASSSSSPHSSSSDSATIDRQMEDLSVSFQTIPDRSELSPKGHLDTHGLERCYQGATHWTTILENIHDIRGLIDSTSVDSTTEQSQGYALPSLPEGPDIVFNANQPLTLEDALAALPGRPEVDRLVSTYFTADFIRAPHIHSQKFLREYQAFWADPSSKSFLWISILFSILWTSAHVESSDSSPDSSHVLFLTKAGQALVTGGYQKARPYSVDAILLYALCHYYLSKENDETDCWMIMGLATRLAVKMGYHRDPSHLAGISPFEGEMRRRSFFLLYAFDIILSIQYGLPAIIQEEECDTEPPRNLLDEDFGEDCEVLPASRPSTDSTPMLYFCYKCRLAKAHKRVIRHALTFKTTSYDDTLRLDAELHANDADVPPSLQLSSIDDLLLDPPQQILRRIDIKFQYLQSICVLHRKFLSEDRTNPAFAYSRASCVDAALQLLKYQAEIYFASQRGGRFQKSRSLLATLTAHHLLVAAMIICLDMYESQSKGFLSSTKDREAQATKFDALRLSHEIWMSRKGFSQDAHCASNVVAHMLLRVPRPNVTAAAAAAGNSRSERAEVSQTSANGNLTDLAANALAGSSSYTTAFNLCGLETRPENAPILSLDATDPLNLIFDGTENINWVSARYYNLNLAWD